MQSSEHFEKFSETLTGMADMYRKKLTAFQITMYWGDLRQYSWDDFDSAATQIRRSHVYNTFPTVAQFIQVIDPPEDREVVAVEALRRFRELMIRYGSDQSIVPVDDPAMVCTVNALGGWISIGTEVRSEFHISQFERDFKKTYAYHLARKTKPASLHLMGYHERDNRANGYLSPANIDHDGSNWFPIYLEGTKTLNRLSDGTTIAPAPAIELEVIRLTQPLVAGRLEQLSQESLKLTQRTQSDV